MECNRCGLYAKGESIILKYAHHYSERCKVNRKAYETYNELDESDIVHYIVVSGYDSEYDNNTFYLTNGENNIDFINEENNEELRNRYPWISDMEEDFDNLLCDDCISDMIFYKELINDKPKFGSAGYTTCCNKYYSKFDENYYSIYRINKFPYVSYYKFTEITDYECGYVKNNGIYIDGDNLFFDYYPNCIVCKSCFSKCNNIITETEFSELDLNIEDLPSFYTLRWLRIAAQNHMHLKPSDFYDFYAKEITLKYAKNLNEFFNKRMYLKYTYMYLSKKNHLALKYDLLKYMARKNLYMIRKNMPSLNKDMINYILKFI